MSSTLYIHNAHLWKGDGTPQRLGSVLVEHGRISAIDPPPPPSSVNSIDAGGRTMTPGFIDAHMHLIMGGLRLRDLDLRDVRSPEEFRACIAERHERLPPGQWLMASNWNAENWGGNPLPDKSWLESAGDRPVVCSRMDLHAAVVNDAVLNRIDLNVDPPGGHIVRDAQRKPTGLMLEAALWKLVNPLIPQATIAQKTQALRAAQSHCHALGITGVGTMEYAREAREILLPLADELSLRCAVTLLDRAWPMDVTPALELARASRGMVFIIGCKAFADGTLGSRTARLLEDYADDPGNRGMFVEFAAEGHLRAWAEAVAEARLSPSIHAIGDAAVRLALDACEKLPRNVRPRVEHAQQIDERDIPRFGQVIASMQPLHKADDGRYALARLGEQRIRGFFPFRKLLDAGSMLAFGSDWPVVTCDPIAGMRAAVTGETLDGRTVCPEENLSVEEALSAYTVDAAKALGMGDAGVISPSAAADLVLFDLDPFTANWRNEAPCVVMTIAGGRIVYDSLAAPVTTGR